MGTKTEEKSKLTKTAEDLVEKFNTAKTYVRHNYHDKWDEAWKAYNNERTRIGYDGVSDTFVPETFTIVESLVANIAGGNPKFEFLPSRDDQRTDTETLNALMDFYWEQNNMPLKATSWIRDNILYGNGVLVVSWDAEKDIPIIENVPLKNFFIDPNAKNLDEAEYVGYRYLTTKDKLKDAMVLNPDFDPEQEESKDNPEFVKRYKNLSKVKEDTREWDDLDKQEKEKFDGTTLGKKAHTKQVEIIKLYTKEKVFELANRETIIYEEDTPFQRKDETIEVQSMDELGAPIFVELELPDIDPFYPFAVLRNYVDASLFFAKGDVEVILPTQELINDISNQEQDNVTYTLNNMWQVDPQFKDMMPQIESIPGLVLPIPEGAINPIEKPAINREADNLIFKNLDFMRRATAADEIVQGVSQQQGRVTATEVQAQLNQANQRFSTKLTMLESEGYAQLAGVMFKLAQIFVNQETAVRTIGPQGVEWKTYNPGEYTGEYEPKVRLEATSRAIKAEEGQKAQQLYQLFIEDPQVNQQELKSLLFKRMFDLKDEEVKKLLTPPPEQFPQQLEQEAALTQARETPDVPSDVASTPLDTSGVI